MTENYFDIKRDNELIAAGTHFWCDACVVAQPLVEQSSDPRYCQSCYEVLKVEAEMQPTRRVAWMPKNMSHKTTPKAIQTTPGGQEVVAKIAHHVNHLLQKKKELCNIAGGLEKRVKSTGRQGGAGQSRGYYYE